MKVANNLGEKVDAEAMRGLSIKARDILGKLTLAGAVVQAGAKVESDVIDDPASYLPGIP